MPTTITSAGITFNDTTSLTSANGVPSALKLTTARTINGVSFDGTANITVPASGTSAAKAWVNFNGTGTIGTNQTIRSSFNVSSVTKNGTGEYTVNIPAGILADVNYSVVGSSTINSVPNAYTIVFPFTTTSSPYYIAPTQTSFRVLVASGLTSATQADSLYINIQVFGN
jgi:hypothetical protein